MLLQTLENNCAVTGAPWIMPDGITYMHTHTRNIIQYITMYVIPIKITTSKYLKHFVAQHPFPPLVIAS